MKTSRWRSTLRSRFDLDIAARLCLLFLLIMGGYLTVAAAAWPASHESSFRAAVAALHEQDPDAARMIEKHTADFPDDPAGIFLAGELAAKQFQHELAIQYFQKLPQDHGQWELLAHLGMAKRYRILGLMLEEEQHLRNVLELDPTHEDANHRLGHLLQVQGRTWESAAPFMMQLRRGTCRGDELMGVATTERFFRADDGLHTAARGTAKPQAIASLAIARRLLFENQNEEAEQLLRRIVAESPQLGEAQGRLGRIIVEKGQLEEFLRWRGGLPDGARKHPEVWFVQGLQARRLGDTDGAIHCLLQAIRLSPNHLPANAQMASCLEVVGRAEAAEIFKHRVEQLSRLETMLNQLRTDATEELIVQTAEKLAGLERYWEAAGWMFVMSQLGLLNESSHPSPRLWLSKALQDPQQNFGFAKMTDSLRLDTFREPNWGSLISELPSETDRAEPAFIEVAGLQFDDDAERLGIEFTYYEGTSEENRLQHIFNVVGGGVAATDLDLDGWPDLYLAQANDWRNPQSQDLWFDGVYRNLRGERFVNVAALANISESRFSHGVSAEDVDQDGFPDIYVCNLGPNQLFHNNGDGTFSDITESAGVAGNEWSVGSVLADLNDDGLPDLYVGNYSKLEETAAKECHRSNGTQMACTPDDLTAESDTLWLNVGDGTFRDITDASGIRETTGRALGLIAWDFGGNGRMSLFVANDTSANFFFQNVETDAAGVPQFREEGVLRGLAFDADGNPQASMGVAAGDANNDGRLDMFVTNFSHESNTLYTQGADGSFYDLTRQFDLRDAGYGMLGFGTQLLDVDGDGWEDLIATNGHVDQSIDPSESDRMLPQLFRNLEGTAFQEIPQKSAGAFFQKPTLGRALATLDWNKDGRTDFAVSQIHSPFSLVTNRSLRNTRPLLVTLVGRHRTRTATGAKVRARIAGKDVFRLVTAGDGYMVSNERLLNFAVPPESAVEELEVRWPNGLVERWNNLAPGQHIALVEGREDSLPSRLAAD